MGILDIFKRKKGEDIMTSHGVTGTDINSGQMDEEYNRDLSFPQSVETYDKMRKSDATVIAVLRAIKQPLLSAKWTIQAGGEDDRDKEIAEFVMRNLFHKVAFRDFLREALGFLDFGFYYFEKNFEVVDGMIEWKEFAPRLPKAHYMWGIDKEPWYDGHPAGVTQQVNSTDETNQDGTKTGTERTIPWDKLIIFSYDREGNNYEGVSILRAAYKHWYYKDLAYKILAVAGERYGSGTPTAKVKSSISAANKEKVVEFLKNIRSNEQSYGVYTDDVIDFQIMTPNGSGVGSTLKDSVDHHDRKIYDSILAGFLNLTTGEGGSNALSKDQSSFFLRGLQGVADLFIENINKQIVELVKMNYSDVDNFPTLQVADIGSISMDEQIGAINTAVTGGLLEITPADQDNIRSILKLPQLPPPDEGDQEIADAEMEMEMEALQIDTLEDMSGMPEAPADNPEETPDATREEENGVDDSEELTEGEIEVLTELADVIVGVELGKPLTDEHKKKISEALSKGGIKGSAVEGDELKSQSDFISGDAQVGAYQRDKATVKSMLEGVRTAMASLKEKKSGMSKEQKKKFAKEFKAKIAEMKTERTRLQKVAKDLKAREKNRKTTLKKAYKDVKSTVKQARKEDSDKAKKIKEEAKAIKKAQKEAEKLAKKKDKNLAEGKYTGCVMLNVSAEDIQGIDLAIDKDDLNENELNPSGENPYHVTLLYGINSDTDLADVSGKIENLEKELTIDSMGIFENDEYDVLVLHVKPEEWITGLNEALRELDYENDYPEYKPHITLGYFKKGEAKKYVSDKFDGKKIKTLDVVYTSESGGGSTLIFDNEKNLSESATPTKREKVFTKNITSFEQYLNKKYTEAEKIVAEAEAEYKAMLTELYDNSETTRVDGVVCLVYDKTKITAGKNKANKIAEKLEKRLIDSALQEEIFDQAMKEANSAMEQNEKFFAYKVNVKPGMVNTFIDGYKSNMQGVIYNENRRVLENITLNYGSESSVDLAKNTADISFNKNILALSFITHPRALYKMVIYNGAVEEGYTLFKTLVPTDKLPNVINRPYGMTASMVFTIQTAAQINKAASVATDGKTAEAITGLGLHHGSFEYYYPISSVNLPEEEAIAKQQREDLKKAQDEAEKNKNKGEDNANSEETK